MSSFRVPHSPASAALVRHRMAAELGSTFPPEVVDAAALVVSELVGNAVRHGSALPGGGLVASWEVVALGLRLQVVDGGAGPSAPAGASVRAGRPADADAEGGRGLELVDALATSWGSAPASPGTAVWAELPATAG